MHAVTLRAGARHVKSVGTYATGTGHRYRSDVFAVAEQSIRLIPNGTNIQVIAAGQHSSWTQRNAPFRCFHNHRRRVENDWDLQHHRISRRHVNSESCESWGLAVRSRSPQYQGRHNGGAIVMATM